MQRTAYIESVQFGVCTQANIHDTIDSIKIIDISKASHVAQLVKHLPTMQETWVQFLGWEVPLEKEMTTHSNILA